MNPSERKNEPESSCHGCAHEASDPCKLRGNHMPSGETACMLCARNDSIDYNMMVKIISNTPALKDSGVKFPCDMYISLGYFILLDKVRKNGMGV